MEDEGPQFSAPPVVAVGSSNCGKRHYFSVASTRKARQSPRVGPPASVNNGKVSMRDKQSRVAVHERNHGVRGQVCRSVDGGFSGEVADRVSGTIAAGALDD
ncbi:hypothetical protein GCM10010464_40890 [Pseudonocardia yunnanensis]